MLGLHPARCPTHIHTKTRSLSQPSYTLKLTKRFWERTHHHDFIGEKTDICDHQLISSFKHARLGTINCIWALIQPTETAVTTLENLSPFIHLKNRSLKETKLLPLCSRLSLWLNQGCWPDFVLVAQAQSHFCSLECVYWSICAQTKALYPSTNSSSNSTAFLFTTSIQRVEVGWKINRFKVLAENKSIFYCSRPFWNTLEGT